MATFSVPGVFIEEVSPTPPLISGAPTSTVLLIGRASAGPIGQAVRCHSLAEFQQVFGGEVAGSELAPAMRLYFANAAVAGASPWVLRIADPVADQGGEPDGEAGADRPADPVDDPGGDLVGDPAQAPRPASLAAAMAEALAAVSPGGAAAVPFNLLVLPPDALIDDASWLPLWAQASVVCQQARAILLLDPPEGWASVEQILAQVGDPAVAPAIDPGVDPAVDPDPDPPSPPSRYGVQQLQQTLVRDHVAIYLPRLRVTVDGVMRSLGPAAAVAGVIVRTDLARGVWRAPAGLEAFIDLAQGISMPLTDLDQAALVHQGINPLRRFQGSIAVWGARTLDGAQDFVSEYKYLPIKRLALYLQSSLIDGLSWTVFEPAGEALWDRVTRSTENFLMMLFRQGAFQGPAPSQAFFARCDASTTTPDDAAAGINWLVVGFAPLKAGEFVILRIGVLSAQV